MQNDTDTIPTAAIFTLTLRVSFLPLIYLPCLQSLCLEVLVLLLVLALQCELMSLVGLSE